MGGTFEAFQRLFVAHKQLNMDILPMDGDFSYEMEFCCNINMPIFDIMIRQ